MGGTSVAAWVAWEKGRDPVFWFVIAFFLSPLVALVALGAVPARHLARARESRPVAAAMRKRYDEAASLVVDASVQEKRWAVSGTRRS